MKRRRIPEVSGGEPDTSHRLRFAIPVETLDLHGSRVRPARHRVRAFLERVAKTRSGQVVRIITGRGRGSPEGPRLRPMVLEQLARSDDLVNEWEMSGDRGSVLVRLR